MNLATDPDASREDDEIEIDRLVLDLPEGFDPDLADTLARELLGRLRRLIEET